MWHKKLLSRLIGLCPDFRGDSAFYTWLYRIAVNSAKNYLVANGRKPPSTDVDAEEADSYDGSEALKVQDSPGKAIVNRRDPTRQCSIPLRNCRKSYALQ